MPRIDRLCSRVGNLRVDKRVVCDSIIVDLYNTRRWFIVLWKTSWVTVTVAEKVTIGKWNCELELWVGVAVTVNATTTIYSDVGFFQQIVKWDWWWIKMKVSRDTATPTRWELQWRWCTHLKAGFESPWIHSGVNCNHSPVLTENRQQSQEVTLTSFINQCHWTILPKQF